jgi:hypothetical protein
MGTLSRTKGKVFERSIATMIRARWPWLAERIRRSIQSRAAEESDVTGLPGFWLECQDASEPTPVEKLEQAERDVFASTTRREDCPVAITHKKRARSIQATLRLHELIALSQDPKRKAQTKNFNIPVTIDLHAFFDLVDNVIQEDKDV